MSIAAMTSLPPAFATVGSLSQLVESVGDVLAKWGVDETRSEIWYRGISDPSHLLVPSLYRDKNKSLGEGDIFERFKALGVSLSRSRPADDWEWYFLAQHHGLPTRLLDWTESLFAAAYFALCNCTRVVGESQAECLKNLAAPHPSAGAVWVLDAAHLNEEVAGERGAFITGGEYTAHWLPSGVSVGVPDNTDDEGRTNERPIAIFPAKASARIIAQQGYFTVHGASEKPLDALVPQLRVARIDIDPTKAGRVWSDLLRCGVNQFALFPDLDALARHIVYIQRKS